METRFFDDDGRLIVERIQDVEPILERNKRLLNSGHDGYTPSRDMKHVGHIPNVVIEQWMKEGVNIFDPNDAPEVERRLNSSEWAFLRTSGGVI